MLEHKDILLTIFPYNESAAHPSVPSSYTFERIQFQKATANNGKRRAQQQYFHVIVELYAGVSGRGHHDQWVLIATKESDPMVVRGRSPGHYKDNNRRDSQASMDPDSHTGPGSDGSSGTHGYGSSYQAGMEWQHQQHSHSHHYGDNRHSHGQYRSCMQSDESPPSAASSTTLTGSSDDLEFGLSDADAGKSPDTYDFGRSILTTPPSDTADETFFSMASTSIGRKRPLEEDSTDEESSITCPQPYSDSMTSHAFEFPALAHSKILCAS